MSNVVEIQFTYTEAEYAEAARHYMNKTYQTRFGLILGLLVFFGGAGIWALDGDSLFGPICLALGALLLLVSGNSYFVIPQRIYKRNPQLREEYRLQFSDEGIAFHTKGVDSALRWSLYKEVWETERFYFLLYGKDAFSLIPKRAFAGGWQERAFKEMLQRHIAPSSDNQKSLAAAKKEQPTEYVPKSLEPPDWR
jgi:YcxB-like protein